MNKVCSDVWTCKKCENYAIFEQNYALELFLVTMAYSCCHSLGGNLDFIQKKFYNLFTYLEYF